MLDVLQILFWSITYILIIVAGVQSRKIPRGQVSMPYAALVLNFSWEICALYKSHGFWAHVLWFTLDLLIACFNFRYSKTRRGKLIYVVSIPAMVLVLSCIFKLSYGMLLSVFVIDLNMAVWYLFDRKKLSSKLKVPIAVTKMTGDASAGLYYAPMSWVIGAIAAFVFACNAYYLFLCIQECKAAKGA